MDPPPGVPGVSKNAPGSTNMLFEVWCNNIAPKLKNIENTLRNQGFFSILPPKKMTVTILGKE